MQVNPSLLHVCCEQFARPYIVAASQTGKFDNGVPEVHKI